MIKFYENVVKKDRMVPTLNRFGYMFEPSNSIREAFVAHAVETRGHMLDIGAAYGVSTLPALQGGAHVIANDLDQRHLDILKNRAPQEHHPRLTLMKGKFPHEVAIAQGSLDGIFACWVLHYLPGEELEQAFVKMFDLLKPGGKCFFWTTTPYAKMFQGYLPTYLKLKEQQAKWPGFVEDVKPYALQRHAQMPARMHLLDEETLRRLFGESGFEIVSLRYESVGNEAPDVYSEAPECLGVIAQKPSRGGLGPA